MEIKETNVVLQAIDKKYFSINNYIDENFPRFKKAKVARGTIYRAIYGQTKHVNLELLIIFSDTLELSMDKIVRSLAKR